MAAACGVICVKRCGWPRADEGRMEAAAMAVAEHFIERSGVPVSEEAKRAILDTQRGLARLAIEVYVENSRKWW